MPAVESFCQLLQHGQAGCNRAGGWAAGRIALHHSAHRSLVQSCQHHLLLIHAVPDREEVDALLLLVRIDASRLDCAGHRLHRSVLVNLDLLLRHHHG